MNPLKTHALLATLALTAIFTFSCSSEEGDPTKDITGYCISDVAKVCYGPASSLAECKQQYGDDFYYDSSCPSGASIVVVNNNSGTFTDSRDGQEYKWVKIGQQIWMAENLNYDVPSNATDLCYDNSSSNCATYGRLYNFGTAQTTCPTGWYLPSKEEWEQLRDFVAETNSSGARIKAGFNLKAKSGWGSNGTDKYGFSALPGGSFSALSGASGLFYGVGEDGYWWSATSTMRDSGPYGYYSEIGSESSEGLMYIYGSSEANKLYYSVRCLRDDFRSPSSSSSSSDNEIAYGSLYDSRDGKTYKTVVIGPQVWMAENLNYSGTDNNIGLCGSSYRLVNSGSYCDVYGRLYKWDEAMNGTASSSGNPSEVQGICPEDWHIPSDDEWIQLADYVGGNAGAKLKAASGWYYADGNGTNDYGFSALAGGRGEPSTSASNYTYDVGESGYWWSATEYDRYSAYYRYLNYELISLGRDNYPKSRWFSIRCVQN